MQLRIAVATGGGVFAPTLYSPTTTLLVLFVSSYLLRMWATEAIYHRYFSHRSYQAGRAAQFLLAVLGTQNGQRGPLWWASIHRAHHQHADSRLDPHSPTSGSFSHAFIAWLWDKRNSDTDLDAIPDFARFRELRWLNKNYAVSFYGGGALLVLAGHFGTDRYLHSPRLAAAGTTTTIATPLLRAQGSRGGSSMLLTASFCCSKHCVPSGT